MLEHQEILARIRSLPPAPAILARVLSIMDDPKAGAQELIAAIEVDPGVTANVLRTCNSPYYAGSRQICTLEEAVHRVGMRTVSQLATTNGAETLLNGTHEGYGLAPGDLWHHSISVAIGSRLLAKKVGFARAEVAYTGGLLHDVGKIVLDVVLRRRYGEVREEVEQGATFQEAEQGVLGIEHAELGARIAESWGFPAPLLAAIRHHHDPESAGEEVDLCSLVHLADALAHWLGVGLGRPGLAVRFESSAVRHFGLRPDDLDRVMIELVERMEETEQSLAA